MVGQIVRKEILENFLSLRFMLSLLLIISIFAISALALLVLAAIFIHSPWAALLSLPAILLPVVFLADLYFWMRTFGMNLDSNAPLSNAIQPFVPPLFGEGKIAQFLTVASWEIGLYMSIAASIIIVVGLYYHRKAYKPLIVGSGSSS